MNFAVFGMMLVVTEDGDGVEDCQMVANLQGSARKSVE